jgi:uncharacterized protein YkwD
MARAGMSGPAAKEKDLRLSEEIAAARSKGAGCMTLLATCKTHESGTRTWTRPKYLAPVAVSLALTTGLATPAMADSTPAPSIGDAVATGDAVEVHTTAMDPMTEQQVLTAEKNAKAARKAAQAAVAAMQRAKHHAAVTLARAYRERTRAAVREAQQADRAAKKATAKAKALKQAAKKATQQAAAVRKSATTQKSAGTQRSAIAPEPSSTSTDRNRSGVMDLANQARAVVGCDPLNYNLQLERSAQGHAQDMSRNSYMSHTSLDGRTFDQRIRATGYDGGRIGENNGAGFGDAGAIMNAWMHSPAHKANILDCRFRNIGVGYDMDGGYWVQNFGS